MKWYAKGAGIRRTGPFENAEKAVKAMTLIGGALPENLCVWPEGPCTFKALAESIRRRKADASLSADVIAALEIIVEELEKVVDP